MKSYTGDLQCPCCKECTECSTGFQKVVDLKNAGLVIYRHTILTEDVNKDSGIVESSTKTTEDVFILHNTKDIDITSANCLPEIQQSNIKCPRCRIIIEHAQKLLQKVPTINRKDVKGICEHCKLKDASCFECEEVVKKFIAKKTECTENTKERVKLWLAKIKYLLKGVLVNETETGYERARAHSELHIDQLCRSASPEVRREPVAKQMFHPAHDSDFIRAFPHSIEKRKKMFTHFPERKQVEQSVVFRDSARKGEMSSFQSIRSYNSDRDNYYSDPENDDWRVTFFSPTTEKESQKQKKDKHVEIKDYIPQVPFHSEEDFVAGSDDNVSDDGRARRFMRPKSSHYSSRGNAHDAVDYFSKRTYLEKPNRYQKSELDEYSSNASQRHSKAHVSKPETIYYDNRLLLEKKNSLSSSKAKQLYPKEFRISPNVVRKYRSEEALLTTVGGITKDVLEQEFSFYFPKKLSAEKKLIRQKNSAELIKDTQEMLLARAEEGKRRLKEEHKRKLEEEEKRKELAAIKKAEEENKKADEETKRLEPEQAKRIKHEIKEVTTTKPEKDNVDNVKVTPTVSTATTKSKVKESRPVSEKKESTPKEQKLTNKAREPPQPKEARDITQLKEPKPPKETRESKSPKEAREPKPSKEAREPKPPKEAKDSTQLKEPKPPKEVSEQKPLKGAREPKPPKEARESNPLKEARDPTKPKEPKPAKEASGSKPPKEAKEPKPPKEARDPTQPKELKPPKEARERKPSKEAGEPKPPKEASGSKPPKEASGSKPPKEAKEPKPPREARDPTQPKESKPPKEASEPKPSKKAREPTQPKEPKSPKEAREPAQPKEAMEQNLPKPLQEPESLTQPSAPKEPGSKSPKDFKASNEQETPKEDVKSKEVESKSFNEPGKNKDSAKAIKEPEKVKKEVEQKEKEEQRLKDKEAKENFKKEKEEEMGENKRFKQIEKDMAQQEKEEKRQEKEENSQQKEEEKKREARKKKDEEQSKRGDKKETDLKSREEARLKLKMALDAEAAAKPETEISIAPKFVEETQMKDLNIKLIKIRKPSTDDDDLILELVRLKQSTNVAARIRARALAEMKLTSYDSKTRVNLHKPDSPLSFDSRIKLDAKSILLKGNKLAKEEIILGEKILKLNPALTKKEEVEILPLVFQSTFVGAPHITPPPSAPIQKVEELLEKKITPLASKGKQAKIQVEQEVPKGVIRYALSDRSFIDKGWTMLPTEKVVRKMNVYRMRPAHPEFDWFEHNKNKRLMSYDSGEKLAEFDDNGRGRWFYRSGRLALDYYDAEEINAQQRFVIYSSGVPDEKGRAQPYTILATFDYLGNGIVFDHSGKIRLKYNQTEGVVLDRSIGPVSHWKWHTLNDPPVLQQVMIDTELAHKDPVIMKLGGPQDNKTRPDNEDMLAIEFDNFIKEKSKKLTQTFKPFQIKMKALKINEHFSLRVLDQATVYLIYRDGTTNLKLNIGMVLDHKEIVDTDTAEVGEVSSTMEHFPARTDSLARLQESVAHAQYYERNRTERERRLHPPVPCASADKLTAAASRPLRPPFRTGPSSTSSTTATNSFLKCSRKPTTRNVYYDSRLC